MQQQAQQLARERCTKAERAAAVEAKIRELVASGEFKLQSMAFLRKVDSKTCTGCALGAFAYACGLEASPTGASRDVCIAAVSERANWNEARALECGFEGWRFSHALDEPEFFAAGERLRDLARQLGPL